MALTAGLLHQNTSHSPTKSEEAVERCASAQRHEDVGDFRGAMIEMGWLWKSIGERPNIEGLDSIAAAEVLLRVGALTGWIGSAETIEGTQEVAKDLIHESARLFEQLGLSHKVAEAQSDLAVCYWRAGEIDEARAILTSTLELLEQSTSDTKARAVIRRSLVERKATRYKDAYKILSEHFTLFDQITNLALKASFNNQLSLVLQNIGEAEDNEEYIDRAIDASTAASFYCEQAGIQRHLSIVENNLGYLLFKRARFQEAHEHLDRAWRIFASHKDLRGQAQVDDTRAQAFIAEGRFREAEKLSGATVKALEKSGENSILCEALITRGIALARIGRHLEAYRVLDDAAETALQSGDKESAGKACLVALEELPRLTQNQIGTIYLEAARFLEKSQDADLIKRLNARASSSIEALLNEMRSKHDKAKDGLEFSDDFSFDKAVYEYKEALLKRALEQTGGRLSDAARLLGLSPANLDYKLDNEFKHLRELQRNRHHKSIVTDVKDVKRNVVLAFVPKGKGRVPAFKDTEPFQISDRSLSGLGIKAGDWLIVQPVASLSEGQPCVLEFKTVVYVGYYHIVDRCVNLRSDDPQDITMCFCEEDRPKMVGKVIGFMRESEVEAENPKINYL